MLAPEAGRKVDRVALYLTISQGPRADRTRPILALSDQRLIGQFLRQLSTLAEAGEGEDVLTKPDTCPEPITIRRGPRRRPAGMPR